MIGLLAVYSFIAVDFVACVLVAARKSGQSVLSRKFWC